jgi:hypothetical protein
VFSLEDLIKGELYTMVASEGRYGDSSNDQLYEDRFQLSLLL